MSIVRGIRIVLWASVPRYIVVIVNTWFSSGIDERRLKLEVVHSKRWRVAPEIITQTNNAPVASHKHRMRQPSTSFNFSLIL